MCGINIAVKYGRIAEAYGVRLSLNYNKAMPGNILLINIPEMEYIVFGHCPFSYEEESETVSDKLENAIKTFDFSKTE